MPSPYTKLSQKEFKLAYANRRTSSKTLKKEAEIKKLFDQIFKKENWGGIRGERRNTGGIFPDDWFRKHISKAIKGNVEALKDLSRITGRKISDLKDAFEKREEVLLETRSLAATISFLSKKKVKSKNITKPKAKKNESKDKEKLIEITERIEKNIYKITNNQTGFTRYRVQIWSEKAPLDKAASRIRPSSVMCFSKLTSYFFCTSCLISPMYLATSGNLFGLRSSDART